MARILTNKYLSNDSFNKDEQNNTKKVTVYQLVGQLNSLNPENIRESQYIYYKDLRVFYTKTLFLFRLHFQAFFGQI